MDTKDIVIIVESVLLAVLLIVLFAVIVRGGGQLSWPFSSKQKEIGKSQMDRILQKSRMVQALDNAEAITSGKPTQGQHAEMMSHGLTAGYYTIGPGGIPVHRDHDLVWDRNKREFVSRYGYKVSDSAYSDL
ncbi:hypothetical protein EXVG_00401 [Emiliania huxleyi virus 202]|nr:hypothetical protein EXVG_00401 [Emiliania huxleyi virus 202]AHA54359.1 hypothetical protein EhV18_00313 [Emiliania huxleyi virus 18]AHA55398.1 hypothetical protein EhV156_00303 [Emiliania huxleyi virus 156]